MRVYPKSFYSIISSITNSSIKGVLLYGPDKGMIEDFIGQIKDCLAINLRKIDYANTGSLAQIFNALSLFDSREIIVVKNFSQSLDKENKQVFEGPLHNFPVLVADELTPSSSLRQFFEKHASLASIACYHDSAVDLKPVVTAFLRKKSKSVDQHTLEYLCENLNNDRQFLYSELDKLCAYCSEQNNIPFEVVEELILSSRTTSIDRLCIAFAKKDSHQYFYELDNLFANNTAEMLVIRSLIRYYTNIFEVKQSMVRGFELDDAVKSLMPPIFFMYVAQFKSIINTISKQDVFKALEKLVNAEVDLKSGFKDSRSILENIFY